MLHSQHVVLRVLRHAPTDVLTEAQDKSCTTWSPERLSDLGTATAKEGGRIRTQVFLRDLFFLSFLEPRALPY